jgi:hypothetical protein
VLALELLTDAGPAGSAPPVPPPPVPDAPLALLLEAPPTPAVLVLPTDVPLLDEPALAELLLPGVPPVVAPSASEPSTGSLSEPQAPRQSAAIPRVQRATNR